MDIQKTLASREGSHGSYKARSVIEQNIKRAMQDSPNWRSLPDDIRSSLEMIATKISRILMGDPEFHDSWHDIIGYAKLVEDRLSPEPLDKQIQIVWGTPSEMIDDE